MDATPPPGARACGNWRSTVGRSSAARRPASSSARRGVVAHHLGGAGQRRTAPGRRRLRGRTLSSGRCASSPAAPSTGRARPMLLARARRPLKASASCSACAVSSGASRCPLAASTACQRCAPLCGSSAQAPDRRVPSSPARLLQPGRSQAGLARRCCRCSGSSLPIKRQRRRQPAGARSASGLERARSTAPRRWRTTSKNNASTRPSQRCSQISAFHV